MFDFAEQIEETFDVNLKFIMATPHEDFNNGFATLGYDSTLLLDNLGTLKFLLIYYAVLGVIVVVLRLLHFRWAKTPVGKVTQLGHKIKFVQSAIGMIMETIFDYAMILAIYSSRLRDLPLNFKGDYVCLAASLLLFLFALGFYIFCYNFFGSKLRQLIKFMFIAENYENKQDVLKTYSYALGEKYLFTKARVDEIILPSG